LDGEIYREDYCDEKDDPEIKGFDKVSVFDLHKGLGCA